MWRHSIAIQSFSSSTRATTRYVDTQRHSIPDFVSYIEIPKIWHNIYLPYMKRQNSLVFAVYLSLGWLAKCPEQHNTSMNPLQLKPLQQERVASDCVTYGDPLSDVSSTIETSKIDWWRIESKRGSIFDSVGGVVLTLHFPSILREIPCILQLTKMLDWSFSLSCIPFNILLALKATTQLSRVDVC